jgi:hypothetical protein
MLTKLFGLNEVRIKQQIKSLLLQHNIKEPVGLARWTKQSIIQLGDMELCPEK